MTTIKLAENEKELSQILALQNSNHFENLSQEDQLQNGFVTVRHSIALLKQMNEMAQQVIAVNDKEVIGYALVMLESLKHSIPVLTPMFATFDTINYKHQKLSSYNYYVMGQVCIHEAYRGKGLFKDLYKKHKEAYSNMFELCVTEISIYNTPSIKAHLKVGFEIIHTFKDDTNEWHILVWDWNLEK